MRRREFVAGSLAAMAAPGVVGVPGAQAAGSSSIPFGVAINGGALVDDYDYRMAVVERCQLVVGEGGLKWFDIRPTADEFNFFEPDRLLDFADKNGMKMRGHTLVWYAAMPDWALALRGRKATDHEMARHIEKVVGRYRGRIPSWDVVNEAIADDPTKDNALRDSVWLAGLGPSYIETAFRRAAAADPSAQLVLNEFDIEFVGEPFARKRAALLDLVKALRDADAPVHAVGFQAHLKGEVEIDKHGVSAFVAELKTMGVDVLVTELDVIDNLLPADIAERDRLVAKRAGDLLDAIADAARPTAVVTWGISDRYTWVPIYYSREDGLPNRPLPLDRNYKAKPLMKVIEDFAGRAT